MSHQNRLELGDRDFPWRELLREYELGRVAGHQAHREQITLHPRHGQSVARDRVCLPRDDDIVEPERDHGLERHRDLEDLKPVLGNKAGFGQIAGCDALVVDRRNGPKHAVAELPSGQHVEERHSPVPGDMARLSRRDIEGRRGVRAALRGDVAPHGQYDARRVAGAALISGRQELPLGLGPARPKAGERGPERHIVAFAPEGVWTAGPRGEGAVSRGVDEVLAGDRGQSVRRGNVESPHAFSRHGHAAERHG